MHTRLSRGGQDTYAQRMCECVGFLSYQKAKPKGHVMGNRSWIAFASKALIYVRFANPSHMGIHVHTIIWNRGVPITSQWLHLWKSNHVNGSSLDMTYESRTRPQSPQILGNACHHPFRLLISSLCVGDLCCLNVQIEFLFTDWLNPAAACFRFLNIKY